MRRSFHRLAFSFGLGLAAAAFGGSPTPAAADTLDVGVGQTYTTIAAAVAAAIEDDVINVVDAVHTEGGIWVNKRVTIQGQGAGATIVQAHANPNTAANQVFTIGPAAAVTIRDMTIRHGNNTTLGGGIYSSGSLTLERISLTQNRAWVASESVHGGGLLAGGPTTIIDCVISNNTAEGGVNASGVGLRGYGGGVYLAGSATLTVVRTIFSGNTALGGDGVANHGGEAWGGALGNVNGTANLDSCLFSGNQALGGAGDGDSGGHGYGGAIYYGESAVALNVTNTTFSGNFATGGAGTTQGDGEGGAIFSDEGVFTNCTIAASQVSGSATEGGGVHTRTASAGAGPTLTNCLVADNTGPDPADGPDIYGNVQSGDYNLIETTGGYVFSGTTTNNQTGVDPNLAALADNGGATWTQALLSPSQAIDLIPVGVNGCVPDESVDQREYARAGGAGAGGSACDIGAFEYDSMLAAIFSDGFESGDTSAW